MPSKELVEVEEPLSEREEEGGQLPDGALVAATCPCPLAQLCDGRKAA